MANTQRVTPLAFLQKHWLLILIIATATFLRVWQLNTHAIFFGDAARDLLVAEESVKTGTLPLLGIPSSVPRFRQGPLTIWMEMIVYLFAGHNLLAQSYFFAFLSVVALIALYELLTIYANRTTAVLAVILFSFSPLAIAHARMPYHTNPIPLFLLFFLFALMHLWQGKKWGVFWSILTFCLAFQFELALAPLILLIPFVIWRTEKKSSLKALRKNWLQLSIGAVIGLAPQLIHDLTHNFEHLGGFAVWVVYRMVSFAGYKQQHTFSLSRFGNTITLFWSYWMKIWSTQNVVLSALCLTVLLGALMFLFMQFRQKKKIEPIIQISTISFLILTIAYFVHGSPSEAYFPPYFILLPILMGYGLSTLWQQKKVLMKVFVVTFFLLYIGRNIQGILQHNFFVSTSEPFNYGYSVIEQKHILQFIKSSSDGYDGYSLLTTREEGKFPSYFANLRWLGVEYGLKEDPEFGKQFFIEGKDSPLTNYPGLVRVPFETVDVYTTSK